METDRIVRKWKPVIEKIFNIKNDYLINLICIFSEKYSQREIGLYANTDNRNGMGPVLNQPPFPLTVLNNVISGTADTLTKLPEKLKEIRSKLYDIKNIEIVKSYYNPFTGLIVHELENGLTIDENLSIQEMNEEKFIQLFGDIGLEILREVDPIKFRDGRIEKILNNG